jgi:glycosyltransferase involved in cell wall biosynthesis
MRILTMVSRDPENPALGGGETVVAEFAKALAHEGHEVHYLCSTFPSCDRETSIEGVHILRLAPETTVALAAYRAYRRDFRGRVDLVLEDFLGGSGPPFVAPLYVREPVISVWHQDHVPIFREEFPAVAVPFLAGLERLMVLAHGRSTFLVPSNAAKAGLVGKGVAADHVRVFHPGVSETLRSLGDPPSAAGRKPQLLCLGKIRRYKCQVHAIRVLRGVLDVVPDARLVIAGRVGDRGYLEEMRAEVGALGLRDRVRFEFDVTEARKAELLRESRALLAPAPVEGFGIAVMEASACGLPAVGTDGVPEDSLRDGTNGSRVPFGDIPAFAAKAEVLLRDDAAFDRLSRAARAFSQPFSWAAAVRPVLDLVNELVGGTKA